MQEEITNSLLVAMMFVVVLTLGIGNILMTFAEAADRRSKVALHVLPLVWLLLLLGQHLTLFWETLEILSIGDWSFAGFVFVLCGPIILFLATSVLLPKSETKDDSREHYFNVARQFFLLMTLVMLWVLGVDVFIGDGLEAPSIWNFVGAAIFATLALVPQPQVHKIGTTLCAVIFPAYWLLRGVGVFP